MLKFIEATPRLTSLLFDLDLHPTQLQRGGQNWTRMLIVVAAVKAMMDEIATLKAEAPNERLKDDDL